FLQRLEPDVDFMLVENERMGIDAAGEPYVPSYHRVMSHHGMAAQDGGIRVNDHIVFYRWVPLFLRHRFRYVGSTQGYALINFDIIANNSCLANKDTCAMVDKKRLPD
ncbi:MAG: hypothetical protein JWP57_1837, partial [Spirosoma sp.]|nr:hypothetical protein [Spirosoma sp.]